MVGLPEEGVLMHPFLELLITTFITAVSSTAMGPVRVFAVYQCGQSHDSRTYPVDAPDPFLGFDFQTERSNGNHFLVAVCRWSMEGYGTTANLNDLPLKLQQEGVMIPHEAESFFEFTSSHLLISWGILVLYTVVFLILARIVLSKVGKEKS